MRMSAPTSGDDSREGGRVRELADEIIKHLFQQGLLRKEHAIYWYVAEFSFDDSILNLYSEVHWDLLRGRYVELYELDGSILSKSTGAVDGVRVPCHDGWKCLSSFNRGPLVAVNRSLEDDALTVRYIDIGDGSEKSIVVGNGEDSAGEIIKLAKILCAYHYLYGFGRYYEGADLLLVELAHRYMAATGRPPWFLATFHGDFYWIQIDGEDYLISSKITTNLPTYLMDALIAIANYLYGPHHDERFKTMLREVVKTLYSDIAGKDPYVSKIYRYLGLRDDSLLEVLKDSERLLVRWHHEDLLDSVEDPSLKGYFKTVLKLLYPYSITHADIVSMLPGTIVEQHFIPVKPKSFEIELGGRFYQSIDENTLRENVGNAPRIRITDDEGLEITHDAVITLGSITGGNASFYAKYLNTIAELVENGEAYLVFAPEFMRDISLLLRGRIRIDGEDTAITVMLYGIRGSGIVGAILRHLKKLSPK
ncbi:MAG: hypothetical protein QXL34_07145 [Thermosphaera sp.]